ncbi:7-cyano-7-deazaguanine synthase QueC [bacterium]|nr:7-cyano-7-deazaguanine synthase QueC [bacterium]
MSKALVLFSGGQDSTTCLYWAKSKFDEVHAIGFDYGQRHRIELEQARKIAGLANVPFTVIDITGLLGNSALTNHELSVDSKHPRDPNLPATFVPGRNLFFLSIAGGVAFNRGISDLVTGVCQTDYSGYPDCRREFIDHMERTLSAAMAPHLFRIHTPIMHIDKADTFKLAADLGVLDIILEQSHTDYHGDRSTRNPWGYGRLDNDASRLRAKGWEEFCRRYPDLVPPGFG